MPPSADRLSRHVGAADTSVAVDAFLARLQHPHRDAVQALRAIVLQADAAIGEGIKWNAPSYRTHEYFATTHLRDRRGIGLILHLGAKPRSVGAMGIDDPQQLLAWLGRDRASLSFRGIDEVQERREPLQAILRQWLAHV